MSLSGVLRFLFFAVIVRPTVYVILGLNIRHWERLPSTGPAVIVANHNSHLDTLVLMALLPIRALKRIRPVAAADYFLRNRVLAWFATQIIGIIPISRTKARSNPLAGCFDAIANGDIIILFPEGSRGTSEEEMSEFKQGIRVIARKFPDVPIYPVYLHGLGKSLPKGEALLVPFFCDVFVGMPLSYAASEEFMGDLRTAMNDLAEETDFPRWE